MAIVHTWRNCRRGRRWSYEEVEHELYQRDQESEAKKRDPEDSERCVHHTCPCCAAALLAR